MKISIITASYNSAKYFEDCINSVLNQDYPDIEYIIIDGGSNDQTLDIIHKYSNKITHWLSEPDSGIYDAINKGIKLATGDIVGILNSDDFFADPYVVSRIAKAIKETQTQIVYADVNFVDSKDIRKTIRHYSSGLFRPWMFRFGFQPAHPTFYTYRENFNKYGLYTADMKIAGDFELLLRFFKVFKLSHAYKKDVWVNMRNGGASTSGFKSVLILNKEILKACKLNGIYTGYLFIFSKYLFKWKSFLVRK